jgi:ABC-type transport system substrate-binding protein
VFGLLGRHFAEAGERERAVRYLLSAGDAARRLHADEEALDHYGEALELLEPTDPRLRETYFKLALTHHLAFDFERADEAWAQAAAAPEGEQLDLEPAERLRTTVSPPGEIVPGYAYSNIGWWLCEQLFRGLLRVDRDLNVVLGLAEECRVSSDGRIYRLRLRQEACWSDGVPVTAHDFAFASRQTLERQLPAAPVLRDVENVRALDDRTLEVRLHGPRSYFPYVLASPAAFAWPRHRCDELGDDWRRPEHLVSNGPFKLAALDGEHMLLRANRFWARPRGNVDHVYLEFRGRWTNQEEWATGSYDFLMWGETFEEGPETFVDSPPRLSSIYLGLRGVGPPFDNEQVRKAFAYGTDRERVALLAGAPIEPAARGGVIPPAMPGHSHRVGLEHDVDFARRLLAEAGHPDGHGLPKISIFASDVTKPAGAEELARQWRRLGASVEANVLSFDDMNAAVHDGTADAWLWAWVSDVPDPRGMIEIFEEVPVYRDAEIDDLVARARSGLDQDERMRLYREVERLWIAERAAIIPIGYMRETLVRRPWVEGLWATPLSKGPLDEVVVRRQGAD